MQSIKRKKAGNNFTILSNEFLRDEKLSLKAKGLLAYILSLPDDWKIYFEEIEKHHKDGKASLRTAWKELESNGYARTLRKIDPETKAVKEWYKEVSDFKKPDSDFPDVAFPDLAFPDVGNKQLLNTNIQSTNKQNTENIKTTLSGEKQNLFQKLSDIYQENFGMASSIIMENIKYDLEDFGYDLVKEAMRRAALSQRNYRSAQNILKDWQRKGVKTLQDVKADDVNFRNRKQKNNSYHSSKIVQGAPEWSNPKTLKDRKYMSNEEVEALINGLGDT
ncbi:DnaD domain protein [Lactococcus taiwanensis]|uniref:DnaD domain protein n=1 Tax=Lactococcus taiwanensis TaxID=1151742 RepID=A0AA45QQV3_9LACT|nr:DnaD domain protein [Lactococcus taiwanensis]QSE76334.1 DnaD domain protein [Lactococcus taiwanensis]